MFSLMEVEWLEEAEGGGRRSWDADEPFRGAGATGTAFLPLHLPSHLHCSHSNTPDHCHQDDTHSLTSTTQPLRYD